VHVAALISHASALCCVLHPARVENEDREPDPSLLNALESYAAAALGPNWGAALDAELIANLGKYRRYDYTCTRDLLRVVRNKRNHFREMPSELQRLMGPLPDGFYRCGQWLHLAAWREQTTYACSVWSICFAKD
jgi:hypothetical protein